MLTVCQKPGAGSGEALTKGLPIWLVFLLISFFCLYYPIYYPFLTDIFSNSQLTSFSSTLFSRVPSLAETVCWKVSREGSKPQVLASFHPLGASPLERQYLGHSWLQLTCSNKEQGSQSCREERSACREKPVLAAECFPINTRANLTGSSPECVLPTQAKNNTATFASY